MQQGEIVIVSCAGDSHVADVALKLREMGEDPVLLNSDDIPLNATLSFRLPGKRSTWRGTVAAHPSGRIIDIDAVRSVWWRRPNPYFGLPPELSEQEREFAKEEIDSVLRGAWSLLDAYWVSYPERIREASWKMEQLQRAARFGFEVPATIITNDPESVREFYDACGGDVVFKVLTDPYLGAVRMADKHPDREPPEARETPTTRITEAEMEQLDSVRLVPCLFQEYVPKSLELRVTVIGDDIFAAEIHSQEHEGTRDDWRNWANGGFEIPYRPASLPADVAKSCMELVRSYDLNFSAIDLVLTPDGRYVFLENNPNGQFIFVEKLVPELEMTAALASCLVRGSSS